MSARTSLASLLGAAASFGAAPQLVAQDTTRVNLGPKDVEADKSSLCSSRPAASGGDAALVVFTSSATNLDPNDTNSKSDVFLRDLKAGTTERIVFDAQGGEVDGDCTSAEITADGRFVMFASVATDLVKGDNNGFRDVFVLDRTNGTVERVSVADNESELLFASSGSAISDDGNRVAFVTLAPVVAGDSNTTTDVYLRDRAAGTTVCVSVNLAGLPGNGQSVSASMTSDGTKVAFASGATDLVQNDGNGTFDVFVRDLIAGTTERVSVNEGGFELDDSSSNPTLSPDGRFVCFESFASNVHRDVDLRSTQIYVRDLVTGELWLASRGVDGARSNSPPSLPTLAVEAGTGEPLVAFWSLATNLSDDGLGDFDLFVCRARSGVSQCASVDSDGVDPIEPSLVVSSIGLSPEGDAVFQTSSMEELVDNDGNNTLDVFRRGLQWTLLSEFGDGLAGSGGHVPHLSGRSGSCEAGRWFVEIDRGLPTAPGTLWIGFGRTNGAKLFGGTFYVDLAQPFLALPIVLGGPAGVFGAGELHLDGANVENLGEFSLYLQCTFLDARAPRGVSISNALEIAIDA